MKDGKSVLYMSLALGMLIYAVPRLDIGGGWTMPTVFGIVWIAFALLVVAAHLHRLLGVDEETKRELARVRHHSRRTREQWVAGKIRMLGSKK
ncbi:hypothetical protein [Paenibacillus flagellatus]|uniref:Uncharacterized protein n=1 Tax=Paenibacillus flagellatus TaxID=2211139 RepID=A0A2V5KDP4_9BACL|nr:hypothetical protein [Paenibacillus flagellatus]PYI57082.1 hypothetical protein DLM86_01130 [Paenibacillus flagellatus]